MALCQLAGSALACFLAGLAGRRLLAALDSRPTAAARPFCSASGGQPGSELTADAAWLSLCCLGAASLPQIPAAREGMGEASRIGTLTGRALGSQASWDTRCNQLFGEPGSCLAQPRASPHLSCACFIPPMKNIIGFPLTLGTNNSSLRTGV